MNRVEFVKVDLEGNYDHTLREAFEKVKRVIEDFNDQGYKVVTVTPLTGSDNYYDDTENRSYGYGYSFTTGILIVFEETNN